MKDGGMGTEKFNYVQPSVANGETVQLQYTVAGDPVSDKVRSNAPQGSTNGDTIALAGLWSTAPYLPDGLGQPQPKQRPRDRLNRCVANDDTCNGWATKTGYCSGHRRLAD
jgi:hypothetical protein